MGFLDLFRKKKLKIEDLMVLNYEQEYLSYCKDVWSMFIPSSGQASCLQGELLRELNVIHREAVENDNKNFDWQCEFFCIFIYDSLETYTDLLDEDLYKLKLILDYFLACGKYAKDFYDGKIPLNAFNENMLAYKDDNLYDMVADAIGLMHSLAMKQPIPYKEYDIITR